jgi:hypothetical protein
MDTDGDARQLRIAFQQYLYAIESVPSPGSFASIHAAFKELSDNNFHIPQKRWLNAFELAYVSNYTAMFGTNKRKQKLMIPIDAPLNKLKKLWKLAEESSAYSDRNDYAGTFALRITYQQLPHVIHPARVLPMLSRMNSLMAGNEMSAYTPKKFSVKCDDLFNVTKALFQRFTQFSMQTDRDVASIADEDTLAVALNLFCATRLERTIFHKNRLELKSAAEKPYEINSLLRYPIIRHGEELYCPYPQLIGYAATRGLFFRCCDEDGDKFRAPFAKSNESYVKRMLSEAMPDAEVLTEDDERRLGWGGKTNDVTVIRGDSAVLIECKLSGLYVNAKRTASPESIIADVRKQIADARDRRGLFQLHDKLQAIQTRLLPQSLLDKYTNVKHFYPVLLLFDDISQANAAEVLGNIIRDELRANGIDAFEYQIWNLEELEWLTEQSGADSLSWIAEKFSTKNQAMDLSSFVADKAHREFLRPIMYLPEGDTRAIQILKGLVAKYAVAQSD